MRLLVRWINRAAMSVSRDVAPASQDAGFELALVEARRGFDEQASQFTKVRATAGNLMGYGGVASSVLVVAPGPNPGPNAALLLSWAAGAFCLLAVATVYVLWPATVIPGVDVRELVTWADAGDEAGSISRDLALHYESAYQTNRKELRRRTTATMCALVLFSTTIVLLAIRLTGV